MVSKGRFSLQASTNATFKLEPEVVEGCQHGSDLARLLASLQAVTSFEVSGAHRGVEASLGSFILWPGYPVRNKQDASQSMVPRSTV